MSEFKIWEPAVQPAILGATGDFANIEWTTRQIFDNLYAPLCEKYPDYVSRKSIGFDTSGKYEMFAFEFCPPKYNKTIYIQSGVHCVETEGYFGLARVMTLIAEGADERLRAMRDNVRFLVVPCVSVYGISTKGTRQNIMSAERYEIKQNLPGVNSNRDYYKCCARETENVKRYFDSHASEISFGFDFHTTTMREWNAYLLPYSTGMDKTIAESLVSLNKRLYEKNKPPVPMAFMGEEKDYPTGAITDSFTCGFFREYGIPSATIEHSDYVFSDTLGTSTAMTRAVELYGNHLLCRTGY